MPPEYELTVKSRGSSDRGVREGVLSPLNFYVKMHGFMHFIANNYLWPEFGTEGDLIEPPGG